MSPTFTASDVAIAQVRPAEWISPHRFADRHGDLPVPYADDAPRVPLDLHAPGPGFERAGPRAHIAWDPTTVTAAVLSAGGLSPGINDVIRAVVNGLHYHYGVRRVLGIANGYAGLVPGVVPIALDPARVRDIHRAGGSILGTARNKPDLNVACSTLRALGIDLLFCIGGDGTLRGAHALAATARARGQALGVIGVPKTIDNDVPWVDRTFGFDTAVEVATHAVDAAHVEAEAARGGVGLVRLMGRDAGFIAAHAALASGDADAVLVPEVPFTLEGAGGLLVWLEARLAARDHAVVVVAEGAGQNLMPAAPAEFDRTGNRLHQDIGLFLRARIDAHLRQRGIDASLKYIDPSYLVRAIPANPGDGIFCAQLGHHAVHAAMAGRTDLVIGLRHGVFTHVPLPLVAGGLRRIDPRGELWRTVLEVTGQPSFAGQAAAAGT